MAEPSFGICEFGVVYRKSQSSSCYSQQITVSNEIDEVIMIQTDKPIYRPAELVRYQIIAMNGNTKPVKLEKVQVEILDGKGKSVSIEETKRIQWGKYGFFQNEFKLAEEPNLGDWTIKVKINNETFVTTQTFSLKQYSLPPFKVVVETNPRVSFYEKFINFNINAKYSFDKFVKGKAKINAKVYSESDSKKILANFENVENIQGEKNAFKIDLKHDLKINFITMNLILVLDVELEEENTNVTARAHRNVLIFPRGKHVIHLKKPQHLRPGFSYSIDAFVTNVAGFPEKSTSIPLTMKLTYKLESNQPERKTIFTEVLFLKNGKATFILSPQENSVSAQVSFIYDQTTISETINKIPTQSEEFLQLTVLTQK